MPFGTNRSVLENLIALQGRKELLRATVCDRRNDGLHSIGGDRPSVWVQVCLECCDDSIMPPRQLHSISGSSEACDHHAIDGGPFPINAETLVARLDRDILEA